MNEGWETCTASGCNSACAQNEKFCAVHREAFNRSFPLEKAWVFLKQAYRGNEEDRSRADEQASMWRKLQQEQERQRQQSRMEGPVCDLCRVNPAVDEWHGDNICEECHTAMLNQMRTTHGLPPGESQ